MKVKDIMTREVWTCRPGDDMNEAARLLWERDCGCLPVVDEAGKPVGMLTDRDICMAAHFQGKPLREIQVRSAMSRTVHTCTLHDTLGAVEKVLQERRVRRLPVVDGQGKLVGIVSLADIARQAARQREAVYPQLSEEEVGRTLARVCEPRVQEALLPAPAAKREVALRTPPAAALA